MKSAFLGLIFILFICHNNFGQSEKKILYNQLSLISNKDSIENIWLKNNFNNYEKLFWLYSLEKTYYIESNYKSGKLLDTIKSIEHKLYQDKSSGLYSFFKANICNKENKLFDAYNSYTDAIKKFKENKDSFGLANSLISISSLPISKDLPCSDNFQYLKSAEDIVLELDNTKLITRLYMAYLNLYNNAKKLNNDKVNEILNKLKLALKGKKDESWGLAYINTNVGSFALSNKLFNEAINSFKTANIYYKDKYWILFLFSNLH